MPDIPISQAYYFALSNSELKWLALLASIELFVVRFELADVVKRGHFTWKMNIFIRGQEVVRTA